MSRVLHGWCAGAAFLSALVGLVVLIGGWILGVEALAVMKRSTAICFALAGAVLWVLGEQPASPRVRVLADAAAAVVVMLAAIGLGGYVTGLETVGRMAPLTSACFLMLGLALLSVDRDRIFPAGQRLAVASGFVALLGVSAWAYGAAETPARTPIATDMPPLAGGLLVVLSIAVTAARPGRGATGIFTQDTAGGMVARWVVPGTIAGSLLIGALGLAGERTGLYGREFGAALTTVASLSLFSALVWFIAVRLHRTDARRLAVETELRRVNAELEARVEARTLALTRSEARYRRVIEESPDGIMIHQEGVVRFLNPAGLRMFGLTEVGQALGLSVLDYIAPEHREAVAARVAARLRGEPIPSLVQIEATRPDGGRFWIGAAATVVDWEGSPAILVSFVDVTEQRRLQAAEQEAESLRAVAKLANAAAHEINNPLTAVLGGLVLVNRKINPDSEEAKWLGHAKHAAEDIRDIVKRMNRITSIEEVPSAGPLPDMLDIRKSSSSS